MSIIFKSLVETITAADKRISLCSRARIHSNKNLARIKDHIFCRQTPLCWPADTTGRSRVYNHASMAGWHLRNAQYNFYLSEPAHAWARATHKLHVRITHCRKQCHHAGYRGISKTLGDVAASNGEVSLVTLEKHIMTIQECLYLRDAFGKVIVCSGNHSSLALHKPGHVAVTDLLDLLLHKLSFVSDTLLKNAQNIIALLEVFGRCLRRQKLTKS